MGKGVDVLPLLKLRRPFVLLKLLDETYFSVKLLNKVEKSSSIGSNDEGGPSEGSMGGRSHQRKVETNSKE